MTVIGSLQTFSDPSSTSTVPQTPTSLITTTASVTATASPTPAIVSSNERTHSSSVAIGVGTGVGVGASLVLLIAVAAFVYRRRRSQPKKIPTGLEVSQNEAGTGAWAFGQGNAYSPNRGQGAELSGQDSRRWEPPPPAQEMGAGEARRVELPADGRS
jgi:hypothetical protein